MSLAAGVSLFSLSRRMGTSVEMIDRTYGHLAPDAEGYERVSSTPTTAARSRRKEKSDDTRVPLTAAAARWSAGTGTTASAMRRSSRGNNDVRAS
jgi:hypothetical protein